MIPLENHGLIIRELRKLQGLNVRKAAKRIGRSIGWLSEIENGCGTARLTAAEFDRIVEALDGQKHRPLFKIWVANRKNQERIDKTFDGAVLKFIRLKKSLTLQEASKLTCLVVSAHNLLTSTLYRSRSSVRLPNTQAAFSFFSSINFPS